MKKTVLLLICALFLYGCASQNRISYLQGLPDYYVCDIPQNYKIKICPYDLLSIMVNSKDSELSQMFNLPMVSYQISNDSDGFTGGQNRVLGYQVDNNGNIDFPQLGVIKVKGLTRTELAYYIKQKLKSGGLLKDPIVTVQFLNFKVSVIGEVNRPGTFNINSDRISIFEALGKAGDMTIYGRRDNVKLIRESGGVRTVVALDLRENSVLSSPYYYLQQNDIIYVEPNRVRAGQSRINQNRSVSTIASILSAFISITTLIVSITK
ncbi:MAG: polysaccharide biosynthesis/export family protein [Bacteroidales bacterium]|jgi:polysaccharide export outer membrane protein|nr:polysaccharide biosynthesis/export family protein [Bacteroidales bacterium]